VTKSTSWKLRRVQQTKVPAPKPFSSAASGCHSGRGLGRPRRDERLIARGFLLRPDLVGRLRLLLQFPDAPASELSWCCSDGIGSVFHLEPSKLVGNLAKSAAFRRACPATLCTYPLGGAQFSQRLYRHASNRIFADAHACPPTRKMDLKTRLLRQEHSISLRKEWMSKRAL
jgi:hypothetical protein